MELIVEHGLAAVTLRLKDLDIEAATAKQRFIQRHLSGFVTGTLTFLMGSQIEERTRKSAEKEWLTTREYKQFKETMEILTVVKQDLQIAEEHKEYRKDVDEEEFDFFRKEYLDCLAIRKKEQREVDRLEFSST